MYSIPVPACRFNEVPMQWVNSSRRVKHSKFMIIIKNYTVNLLYIFSFRHEHLAFYLEQILALLHLNQAEEVVKVTENITGLG